jgi:hypothetical protein
MLWLVVVALIVIALTGMYAVAMRSATSWYAIRLPFGVGVNGWGWSGESFTDYFGEGTDGAGAGPDGVSPEIAGFATVSEQGLLAGVVPVDVGLTPYTAQRVAEIDQTRQMELGGQYVQRTNNYRRRYPDNWTAPASEFVGSMYRPKDGVGEVVPCKGAC